MIEVFFADCPEDDEHRYGHALARYSLERLFGRCELILKPHMKPEASLPGAYLSISHSVNVCAVAASDIPVGLDIELTTRNADRLLKLAERFFSPDEFEYVKAMPEQRFYEIWCKKESYVKYTGEGFRRIFPGFSEVGTRSLTAENARFYYMGIYLLRKCVLGCNLGLDDTN